MEDTKYLDIIKAPVITEKSQIAKEAGQVSEDIDDSRLFSEDLY